MRVFVGKTHRSGHKSSGCVIAAVLAIALIGCGSRDATENGKEDPSESARKHVLVAEALAVTFDRAESLTSTKQALTEGTVVVRTTIADGTPECHMRISNGRFTGDFVVNDSGLYTRANEEGLRRGALERGSVVPEEQIEAMADRWVKRGEDRADMMRKILCPPKARRDQLEKELLTPKNLRHGKEQTGTLKGRPTTKLTFTGGSSKLEIHIAAEGRPYLLKIIEYGGVVWEFGDFNKPYRTSTPKNAIDEMELAGGLLDVV